MHSVEAYRMAAIRRLPKPVFDYLEGGADDETGLAHNRKALEEIKLIPRRLRNVSGRTAAIELFGERPASAPLIIAPTGFNGLVWPSGDAALARAARDEGLPFVLSTASNTSIEDLSRQSDGDLWFQLYVLDRELAESLVRRAFRSNYSTLILTVDVTISGNRERDVRNRFGVEAPSLARRLMWGFSRPRWASQMLLGQRPILANLDQYKNDLTLQTALINRNMDDTFDWSALRWLRDIWPRKLLVKGILHPEDAGRCIALGVDGVVLSNHGGRQLDAAISPVRFLREIASAHSGRVFVDSGFRRGSDVIKAIALGASGVLIGRSVLYGLAVRGEQGAREVMQILKKEVENTLCHLGCRSISDVSLEHIG